MAFTLDELDGNISIFVLYGYGNPGRNTIFRQLQNFICGTGSFTVWSSMEIKDSSQFHSLLDVLGKGSMANVSLVLDVKSRLVGTLKIYKPNKLRFAQRELMVFQQTKTSPFLAHCLDAFMNQRIPIFLTEFAPFGTLDQLTLTKNGLGSQVTSVYAIEITHAVEFLHRRFILHRDIKPANVLILITGHVVLGDFSSAYEMTVNKPQPFQVCGTHVTRPPEVWSCRGYGFPVDVWQMGITFYNLVSNRWPFFHASAKAQATAVKSRDSIPFPGEKFTPDTMDLITQMLQVDPEQRILPSEIRIHKYFGKLGGPPYQPPIPPAGLMELMNFSDIETHVVKQLLQESSLE